MCLHLYSGGSRNTMSILQLSLQNAYDKLTMEDLFIKKPGSFGQNVYIYNLTTQESYRASLYWCHADDIAYLKNAASSVHNDAVVTTLRALVKKGVNSSSLKQDNMMSRNAAYFGLERNKGYDDVLEYAGQVWSMRCENIDDAVGCKFIPAGYESDYEDDDKEEIEKKKKKPPVFLKFQVPPPPKHKPDVSPKPTKDMREAALPQKRMKSSRQVPCPSERSIPYSDVSVPSVPGRVSVGRTYSPDSSKLALPLSYNSSDADVGEEVDWDDVVKNSFV